MTFTLEKEYVYFAATLIVLLIQAYNSYKLNKLRSEVDSLWQQIAIMGISAGQLLEKIQKKIDEKQDK